MKKTIGILLSLILSASLLVEDAYLQDLGVGDRHFPLLTDSSESSEILWSWTILYHSSSGEDQQYILENIPSQRFKNAIDTSSTRNSILQVSQEFKDETLFMVYLLNEANESIREKRFEDFYASEEVSTDLKDISTHIVRNSRIDLSKYDLTDHTSVLYFLIEYSSLLSVIDSSIYNETIQYKTELYSSDMLSEIEKELLIAATFTSYYFTNQFNKIEEIYDDLISLKKFPNSYAKSNLFRSLNYVMYQTGNLDKSLEVQREFLIPLSIFLQNYSNLNSIYIDQSTSLYALGKYQEAKSILFRVLENSESLDNHSLAKLHNNLALVYFKTGESAKYVENQLKALEFAQSSSDYEYQIKIYRHLHVFYRKNQNLTLATSYIDRASELAESISNNDELISILVSKAAFERTSKENSSEALSLLNRAETLIDENTPSRLVVRIFSEKADIFNSEGKVEIAINLHNKIVEIGKAQSDPSIFLEAIIEVAALEINRRNFGDAEDLLRQFKNHDTSVVDFSVLTQAQIIEAKLAREEGTFAKADQGYKETVDMVLDRARYTADVETGYWTVESEYLDLFESYADFLIERGKNNEAVQLLDRVKTINDASMLQNPLVTSRQLTEEQLAKEQTLTRDLERLRRMAFSASGSERLELNTRIERLQAQKRDLHQSVRSFEAISIENPVWSVQRALSSSDILLHVTNVNQNYYISKISPSSVSIEKLEITPERKELFETAIQSMISGRTDLEKLYEVGQLIGLNSLPSSITSVVMMADGYLHQLPIDVIPVEKPNSPISYGSTKYLVEEVSTRHLNHLGELFESKKTDREFEHDFSGFGVADFQNTSTGRNLINLPSAPDEIESISSNLTRFSGKAVFTESSATPGSFRKAAGSSRILHMATHSEISESDPLFSRIHLVPDSESDDQTTQIFAYELFDLNLQNELIMLNSCESGGDRSIQGSGIMGISRALHYAGAQSLILNAWSVNDKFAADFANSFYTHINEGETKSRALQLAKIDFIKTSNSNPHFWGPYILNGSNEPLIQKRGTNFGNVLVALMFVAGFILVSRSRQRAA